MIFYARIQNDRRLCNRATQSAQVTQRAIEIEDETWDCFDPSYKTAYLKRLVIDMVKEYVEIFEEEDENET